MDFAYSIHQKAMPTKATGLFMIHIVEHSLSSKEHCTFTAMYRIQD